ncbi:MAG: hypothetical protein SFV54_10620 [Bryobacteraceae bacterium]|nr:hypothetical protein [Bryobacteraceae bacterium]
MLARTTPLYVCLLPSLLSAQQAIVNMPSADITPKGKVFLMHETQMRAWNPGRYWYGTNFFAYGVGRSTELAVTTYNAGSPRALNEAVGFGFKSSPQILSERWASREMKVTVGQMAVVNYRGGGLGSFSYSHFSLRVPGLETRLTAGGWYGTKELFKKDTGNFLGGIEQPVGKKFVLLAEWFRGRHDFGFFIPGVLYHPTKRHIIVAAYKIANTPANGKNGLVLEYGITF